MALSACGLTSAARLAYDWLRHTQRADGSWPKRVVGDTVTDAGGESNQTAYVAVGTWHEFQVTGDEEFLALMWPTVRRAMGFVLSLQVPRGEILWQRAADGMAASYALLTGCASTYQSLCCAVWLAEYLGEPQPAWELARPGWATWWPATRRRSRTRAGSRWTGTTRYWRARCAARPGWTGWTRSGPSSWSPGWVCAVSATSPGSPGRKRASW